MGLADTVTKAYMKDNSVFADAFNYLIYGGEAVVDPNWILRRLHYRLDRRMKMENSLKKQFRNTVMC